MLCFAVHELEGGFGRKVDVVSRQMLASRMKTIHTFVVSLSQDRPVLVGRLRTGPGQVAWEPRSHSGSVTFRGTPSLWLPPLEPGIAPSSSAFELLNLHLQYVAFLKHSDTLELLQQAQACERSGSAYIPVLPTQKT